MADTLSRKEEARLMAIHVFHPNLQEEIDELELEVVFRSFANLTIQPTILDGIKIAQALDTDLVKIVSEIH